MTVIKGSCSCGNIGLSFETRVDLRRVNPRACDCDFCTLNKVSYFSDNQGVLHISIKDRSKVNIDRHGSEQAQFHGCNFCSEFVFVSFILRNQIYAAINTQCLPQTTFAEPMLVQPKLLSKQQKLQRWTKLWFNNVKITENL